MTAMLPTGVVTLLYADVEDSSLGWQTNDHALYHRALLQLQALARESAERQNGAYIWHSGDGFLLAFQEPLDSIDCARELQQILLGSAWPIDLPRLRVRMGIHTDSPTVQDGEYSGFALWRSHRLMDAANGGQVLLSAAAYELVQSELKDPDIGLEPLGSFRLRDLQSPERLYRLTIPDLPLCLLPPRVMPEGRHNFPEEERPFIGRRKELGDIERLFHQRGARLATITGCGGIGKTRLAKQAAAQMIDEYPDGIWLVELEALESEEEILMAICQTLDVDPGDQRIEHALFSALEERKTLLVIDCFERLVDHARLLDRLIRETRHVRCLVTSRRTLGLPREFEYCLSPMAVDVKSRQAMSDSMELFVEAAQHVDHEFELNSKNRSVVRELCELLEGVPLSIILAASRLRYVSLNDLLDQARSSRLDIARSRISGQTKHASLERVVSDSVQLLPSQERELLQILGIFVGGFNLSDALAVCRPDRRTDVEDGIEILREHSLVQVQTHIAHARYRLLDSIREYLAQLSWPQKDDYRRNHAERFGHVASNIGELMTVGRWTEGTTALRTELGNIRAAIAYCVDNQLSDEIVAFADALGLVLVEAGLWQEMEALAREAEAAIVRLGRHEALPRLLGNLGALARQRGAIDEARRHWERRLRICEAMRDLAGQADTLNDLAGLAHLSHDLDAADRLGADAAVTAGQAENIPLLANIRARQALIALDREDRECAVTWAGEADLLIRDEVDKDSVIFAHANIGKVMLQTGDIRKARESFESALRMACEGERNFAAGHLLLDLARLYDSDGDEKSEATALYCARAIHAELGSRLKDESARAFDRFLIDRGRDNALALLDEAEVAAGWRSMLRHLVGLPVDKSAIGETHPNGHNGRKVDCNV